jgi:hypothetical protein
MEQEAGNEQKALAREPFIFLRKSASGDCPKNHFPSLQDAFPLLSEEGKTALAVRGGL